MKTIKFAGVAMTSLVMLSTCGKKSDDSDAPAIPATITVGGTLTLGSTSLNGEQDFSLASAPAAGDKVRCVTFDDAPAAASSTVASDGKFSLTMPGGKAFGCFLNDSANNVKATFVFASTNSVGSGGASSVALGKDVNFGTLSMGADGKISVPAAVFETSTASAVAGAKSNGFDLDLLHNKAYKFSCIDTGDATSLAACKKDMESDGTGVFWRIVKGTENGKAVVGIGAWASKADFVACGSIDGTTAEKAAISGVTFTQFDSAAAYSTTGCKLRSGATTYTLDNLQNYYMLAEAKSDGAGGFSTRDTSEYKQSANCTLTHTTSIVFTGTAAKIVGAFITGESAGSGCTATEKANAGEYQASFSVEFKPI